ncbi:MAG TPA: hypothetical protein DCW44_05210 [Eubacterium sp.]|nr:hypothetical protein [Eubacterium sp.]
MPIVIKDYIKGFCKEYNFVNLNGKQLENVKTEVDNKVYELLVNRLLVSVEIERQIKNNILEIGTGICTYLKSNNPYKDEVEFDKFHKKYCDLWCGGYKDVDNDKILSFSVAQMVVNMYFKYLYCWAIENGKKRYFVFCHASIDTYILNRVVKDKLYLEEEVMKNKGITRYIYWFHLDYEMYIRIQELFRSEEYLGRLYKGFSPLKIEFVLQGLRNNY